MEQTTRDRVLCGIHASSTNKSVGAQPNTCSVPQFWETPPARSGTFSCHAYIRWHALARSGTPPEISDNHLQTSNRTVLGMFWHVFWPSPPFNLDGGMHTRHVLACFGMFPAPTLPSFYMQQRAHGMFWHVLACFQPRPSLLFTYSHGDTACFGMLWHVSSPDPPFSLHTAMRTRHVLTCFGMFHP